MEIKCFDPIAESDATVLILGTMPGITSLKTKQYYGHRNNLFWDIIFRICIPEWKSDELVSADYETKVKLLLKNQIAVWDVLQFCDRKGSLDKEITNQIHNDFESFFQQYPSIKTVFFNGKKAEEYFEIHKSSVTISYNRVFVSLPSTSPSNTTNSFLILKEWLQIRKYINN
jgi:hypoxanthine-DNA glycosylase